MTESARINERPGQQDAIVLALVKQRGPTTCGQACVAMLLGISLEEAIERVGHDGITDAYTLLVGALGINTRAVGGEPSRDIVALQKHVEPNGVREHWTVSDHGRTLDPACIGSKLWPVYQHFVVR